MRIALQFNRVLMPAFALLMSMALVFAQSAESAMPDKLRSAVRAPSGDGRWHAAWPNGDKPGTAAELDGDAAAVASASGTLTNVSTGNELLTLNSGNSGNPAYKYWNVATNYVGASRFPGGDFGTGNGGQGNNLNYASDPIIALGSASNRIFIAGRNYGEKVTTVAEFSFTLSSSGSLSSLPIATNTQGFREILNNGPVDGESWSGRTIGAMANVNGRLMVSAYGYYDGTNRPIIVADSLTLSSAGFRGYFDMPNRQHAGGWLTPIPASRQAAFGGTHLFGFSMSQTRAILTKYSIGPSAYVYDANASNSIFGSTPLSNGSTLTAPIAMDFDISHGLTPQANLGNAGTTWTYCSGGQIGFIVPGTKTYMVLGISAGHASGSDYFDPAPYDASFKGYGPNDPADIYNYYWLFNVDDMLAAKNGTIQVYDPDPYEQGQLSLQFAGSPGWTTYKRLGGAFFDLETSRLYITLARADGSQASESTLPLLIVYNMAGLL